MSKLITKEVTRIDVVIAARKRFPYTELVISTNLAYPLSVAKELGEVWVVDRYRDVVLYSTKRANHVALRELSQEKTGLGVRPASSPLPKNFKDRLKRELHDRMITAITTGKDDPKRLACTKQSFDWFGPWLGLEA